MYGEQIYKVFLPLLRKFERKHLRDKVRGIQGKPHDVILFGHDLIGSSLLKVLRKKHRKYLVVDQDPDIIDKLQAKRTKCIYGDAGNIEFISQFNFKKVKMVVSTIRDFEISNLVLQNVRKVNQKAAVILTAYNLDDALDLYKEGADYVIVPHVIGGEHASELIDSLADNPRKMLKEKLKHMTDLKRRKRYHIKK